MTDQPETPEPIDVDTVARAEDAEMRELLLANGWRFIQRSPNRLGRIAVLVPGTWRLGDKRGLDELEVFKYVTGSYVTRVAVDLRNKVVYRVSGAYVALAASVWMTAQLPEEPEDERPPETSPRGSD